MKKLAWIVFIFLATAAASAQQTVVRVVACNRTMTHGLNLPVEAVQPIDAPANGWPPNLGAFLDELERRTAIAPIGVQEVERAALDPGQERTIARTAVTLIARSGDTADVKIDSAVVHVAVGGTVVVGNQVHFFAVSVLDAGAAFRTPDPLRISKGVIEAPQVVSKVNPLYPEEARKAHISGIVIVQAEIDREGNVAWVHVLKPLPNGLTESALDAVRQWRFSPSTLDGKPVAVLFNLTTNFKLN